MENKALKQKIFSIKAPEDYPEITIKSRLITYFAIKIIYERYKLWPNSVMSSIEGGLAAVYNNGAYFNKKELFIEVYNDGGMCLLFNTKFLFTHEFDIKCIDYINFKDIENIDLSDILS